MLNEFLKHTTSLYNLIDNAQKLLTTDFNLAPTSSELDQARKSLDFIRDKLYELIFHQLTEIGKQKYWEERYLVVRSDKELALYDLNPEGEEFRLKSCAEYRLKTLNEYAANKNKPYHYLLYSFNPATKKFTKV